DLFASSAASTGDLIAVGAPGEQSRSSDPADNTGNAVGAIYLFDPDLAGVPEQVAYLKASNADDLDRFGSAVAMRGDRLLVGAPFEASSAAGVNADENDNSLNNAGAAYLFEPDATGSYVQTAYLKASNPTSGTDNQFGNAVDLSGETLAIAAWRESSGAAGIDGDQTDTSAPNAGAVYVFEQNENTWQQAAYVKASNPDTDHNFGAALALDGDTLAVGAPGENTGQPGSGAVYVFTRDDLGQWHQEAFLKAGVVGLNDAFGARVALVGDLLAVGAPGERSDATGINGGDNNESAVGSGAAYLFERDAAGSWTQIAYVKASNTDPGDSFGSALALDGDTLVIGAPSEQSSATGVDGDEASNAAPDAGAAYVIR
ncbi:MAG: integrin, partial [Gammaproteobacteria bacterium]